MKSTFAILALLSVFVLFSCIGEKKRAEICRTCPVTIKDIVRTEIKKERYDSLIYISVKGDTVRLASPCADLCDSLGHLKKFSYEKKDSHGIKTWLKSKGDTLTFGCNLDSMQFLVKGLNTQITTLHSRYREAIIELVCNKQHINIIHKICLVGFSISLLIFGLQIYFAGRRSKKSS